MLGVAVLLCQELPHSSPAQALTLQFNGFHSTPSGPGVLLEINPELILNCDIRVRIFKLLMSPRIDSKEPIPQGWVAWRAGMTTLFLLGS
jgi:hypothetical protein